MTVWIKQGVCGDLTNECTKALGRIADCKSYRGEDTFITAKRDGNHMAGSLHYRGDAFDIRKGKMSKSDIINCVGPGFDIVEHETHFHIEYDPK
jgi:hypothetical protein